MQVYLSKDGKQYGPYTVEQLRKYVQQGNFTAEDLACHDGQNWVRIADVPGFAEATHPAATPSPTTPQRDQAVQENAVEQQPASADASNSPAKKKKIILWASIGGVATLLVAGLLIWILGGDEGVPESNQSPAEPPDAKPAQVSKIDLDDPKTFNKIAAKAVNRLNGSGKGKNSNLQTRIEKGEELLYRKNQPKPYTGWTKEVWLGNSKGQIRRLTQYKGGKKDGPAIYLQRNGQKWTEHTYKDGKLDGLFTRWYEHLGQKSSEGNYKGGKLMSVVAWKPNGERCPVTNIVDGNGVWVSYEHAGHKGGKHPDRRWTYREGKRVDD